MSLEWLQEDENPMPRMFLLFLLMSAALPAAAESLSNTELDFGFGRVTLPPALNWSTDKGAGNHVFAHRVIKDDHSIVAGVRWSTQFSNETAYLLLSQPENILQSRVSEIHNELDQGRFPVQAFEQLVWNHAGASCKKYQVNAVDSHVRDDSGVSYPFRAIGVICIVSKYPAYFEMDYSERHAPSEPAYGNLDKEADAFFKSLLLK
ncbi:hypothetical protein [Aliiroseovarius sp. PrR006]|uniref:hypothetical protein n=1 Tax=Aliiroseovarius sp. PrR006 TaxID=2706883 RepID=UPI0013D76F56|nr:hypothetical protein [Aliiroseovarius sp. PrR006]NDW54072.1 hypothetical protein [Aliiroseovarius sp. PrR006]